MMDPYTIYATAGLIVGTIVITMALKRFDPFAPIWLFLVGYAQVYVVQALTYREYVLRVRGPDVTAAWNLRALWALSWFLLIYFVGPSKWIARRFPTPPRHWSVPTIAILSPLLILWGLYCAGVTFGSDPDRPMSDTESLIHTFPLVMLVGGILVLVTGRNVDNPRPAWTFVGLGIVVFYVLIWMFNAKRSHSLFGVLTGLAAYYVPRYRRPSKAVLTVTAFLGALAVSVAIGWRNNGNYERSVNGFGQYLSEFNIESVLVNANMKERNSTGHPTRTSLSKETEEYCAGMMIFDTVPEKSEYDYGASYNRLWSTFVPRMFWPDKPFYGRDKWVAAWMAGSEFKRKENFTGPAIAILGATHLNGGAAGTLIVLGVLALMLRSGYEYFRAYCDVPWVQAWWALTYYNAWLMTVNDDPFVWFYYNYGFTTFIPMTALWFYLKLVGPRTEAARLAPAAFAPA